MKLSESYHLEKRSPFSRAKIALIFTMLASSTLASETWNAVGEQRRRVQWVVDGDTFKVCPDGNSCKRDGQISIRIKGLECPESSDQACDKKPDADCRKWIPKGKEAKKVAISILKNQNVTLIPTGSNGHFESGGYSRPLAYVDMPNGSDYGLKMIEMGLCQDFSYRYPHDRSEQYQKAQLKAGVFPIRKK